MAEVVDMSHKGVIRFIVAHRKSVEMKAGRPI